MLKQNFLQAQISSSEVLGPVKHYPYLWNSVTWHSQYFVDAVNCTYRQWNMPNVHWYNRACRPGDHYWNYNSGALFLKWSLQFFEDQAPMNFIYGYLIFVSSIDFTTS